MTELSHVTEPDPDRGEAQVTWPATPAPQAAHAEAEEPAAAAGSRDPAVDALLDRLAGLQDLPVAHHGEVYAGLHDDLLAALNESVTTSGGHRE
jgi:hypothetical protein